MPKTLKAGQTLRQTLDGKPAYLVRPGPDRGQGAGGQPVTANARDGVAVVDLAEIDSRRSKDSEIVLVETDQLN